MRHLLPFLLAVLSFEAAAQQPPSALRAGDVLALLKDSISWYRHVNTVERTPAMADDVLLAQSTQASALKALQLAFEFGHAATSLAQAAAPNGGPAPSGNLAQSAVRAEARVQRLQAQIKDLDAALASARGKTRPTLRAQRNTIQAELNLALQVHDTVKALAAFTPNVGPGGLGPQIDELERSVPEAAAGPRPPAVTTTANANTAVAAAFHPESIGIIGLVAELFTLSHNRSLLRDVVTNTGELSRSLDRVRTPLLNDVRGVVRRSDELGAISGDEDVGTLDSDQRAIENLTARFKQLSAVLVPLREQKIVLGTVSSNLSQAMDGIHARSAEAWRYLLLRLSLLALGVGAVLLLSALWRRISLRYIRDARRRTQFMALRRVLVTCAVVVVVVLSFVTEFGSLATYAGLLTAGIAVALQNVILSVVAYFFLIGRYGIRSGDRVTISGVTGTVIEIGLVRMYLAELAGTGGELRPTGRIVVYSNSVLFQPSALFKQMPETDYVWHTVRLILKPDSDFHLAETRITQAMNSVYQNYRTSIDQQHAKFERAVDAQITQPQPQVRLHYTDAGLEALVVYPAPLQHASMADDQVMKAVQEAIAEEPGLAPADGGSPRLVANVS